MRMRTTAIDDAGRLSACLLRGFAVPNTAERIEVRLGVCTHAFMKVDRTAQEVEKDDEATIGLVLGSSQQ